MAIQRDPASGDTHVTMAQNEQSLQIVRVVLNSMLPRAAMIIVSSASEQDGQFELACGLAQAFCDAGRKTALIDLHNSDADASQGVALAGLSMGNVSVLRAPRGPVDIEAFIAKIRAEQDVSIVASPPIVANSSSLDLCRISDGVVLAVRLGRKVTADDENTVTQLQRVGANLLGLIATSSETRSHVEPSKTLEARPQPVSESSLIRHVSSLIGAAPSLPLLMFNRFRGFMRSQEAER